MRASINGAATAVFSSCFLKAGAVVERAEERHFVLSGFRNLMLRQ